MADNYTRQGDTFRAEDLSGVKFPTITSAPHARSYKGKQVLTLTASAQSLSVASSALFAEITAEGSAPGDYCRYWHDGTSPSSSSGVKFVDGETILSCSPATFQAINSSGTVTLYIEYFDPA